MRDQRNGKNNAPYAQRLDLGWVIVGDVCLSPNHLILKERFPVRTNTKPLSSPNQKCPDSADSPLQHADYDSLGAKIFERTGDDNKFSLSIEDKQFIRLMEKEMFINDANSWVAPLPFCVPRPCQLNNRELALIRFTNLC